MRTSLLCLQYLFVFSAIVGLSGCQSGRTWPSPNLAFWRSNPFKSSAPMATPSQLAASRGAPAPGSGYAPTGASMTPPAVSLAGSGGSSLAPSTAANNYMYPRTQTPNAVSLAGSYREATRAGSSVYAPQQGPYGSRGSYAGSSAPSAYDTTRVTGAASGYVPARPSESYAYTPPPYRGGSSPSGSAAPNPYATRPASGSRAYQATINSSGGSTPRMTDLGPRYSASTTPSVGTGSSNPTGTIYPAGSTSAPASAAGDYGSPAPSCGPNGCAPGSTDCAPGSSDFAPGMTGYNPPGVKPYSMPPAYVVPGASSGSGATPYRPAGTGDYQSAVPSSASSPRYGSYEKAASPAVNSLYNAASLPSYRGNAAPPAVSPTPYSGVAPRYQNTSPPAAPTNPPPPLPYGSPSGPSYWGTSPGSVAPAGYNTTPTVVVPE